MSRNNLKAVLLCTTFALFTAGCDQKHQDNTPQKAPAAATQTAAAPAATQPATTTTIAAPAVVAPAKEDKPTEPAVDERTFSNGERVGHVTKFSFKSSPLRLQGDDLEACKNWEGEMSMDNTVANNSVGVDGKSTASNAFAFSVGKGRKDIVKKVQNAMRDGYKVSLQYNQVVHHDECKSRTDYYVVGVTNLDAPKYKPAKPAAPKAQ
ncbi:MAG: hypothetical protein PW788_12950 [Micavibrio sp.]|nr:hypothetical protein [Micavibrio sp.]